MNAEEINNFLDNNYEEPTNENPANADRAHIQNVLNTHEAGRLLEVLTCRESFDGANWTVLARDMSDNLVHLDVCSEPGYNDVEVLNNYTR